MERINICIHSERKNYIGYTLHQPKVAENKIAGA